METHLPAIVQDEQGQTYIEFLIVFPLLAALLLFIGIFGWFWWEQTTAATAIHNGVYLAAVENGDRGVGYAVTRQTLNAALGGAAAGFEGRYVIVHIPEMRSTWGGIAKDSPISVPFLGTALFRTRAMSFQRTERFYGGPPEDWE